MPYEFLEDVATADIAFKAIGKDLNEVFISAAEACMNVMVEDPDTIQPRETRKIELQNEALDLLLFDFLQEFIYYKDSEQLLLRVHRIDIETGGQQHRLRASTQGEKLDPERHHQRVDVKAVTLHQFDLKKTPHGWEAFVILDI